MLPSDLPRAPIPAARAGSRHKTLLGERIPLVVDQPDEPSLLAGTHLRQARIHLTLARAELEHVAELMGAAGAGGVQVIELVSAVRRYERRLRRARRSVDAVLALGRRASWRSWWAHTRN